MRSFAYGHTRIPEFAFGGATQFILKVHERFDVHGALRVPHTVWNTLELYLSLRMERRALSELHKDRNKFCSRRKAFAMQSRDFELGRRTTALDCLPRGRA
jgi:hypothetical protein